MAILIGTPNNRGLISTVHFQMIVQTLAFFQNKHPEIEVHHKVSSCTVIGFARNALASVVFEDPTYSHLLLVDPDLSVPPETIMTMLSFDRPVVACPYPTRDWNRQAFAEAARKVEDPVVAEACAMRYVGGDDDLMFEKGSNGRKPIAQGPFGRVSSCGAGVLLVSREALLQIGRKRPDLILTGKQLDYTKFGYTGERVLECFEHGSNMRSDRAVEGASFAQIWTDDCGGQIWTFMEATVMRYMEYRFVGHFASKLKLGMV